MVKTISLLVFLVAASLSAIAQEPTSKVPVNIKAILVDKDLNQKPLAKARFTLRSVDPNAAIALDVTTSFTGDAQVLVPAGDYRLVSVEPVDFQGKRFSWNVAVKAEAPGTTVEISNDNASTTGTPAAAPVDDLVPIFKQYRDSVVTVEAEYGPATGTGFIIDPAGIILTNEHVVTESEFVAVKFDATHRLRATVLASDAEKDCAVLWVDLSRVPKVAAIPLLPKGEEPAVEGEKVLTIGSPLGQSKVMNIGIVSKVDKHTILSGDLNINHGNSGGPLFNSHGFAIGITQFALGRLSGIIRIEDVMPIIEEGKTNMATATKPSAEPLPNEPEDTISVAALKRAATEGRFKASDYAFIDGNYFVGIITPVYKYHQLYLFEEKAEKEKEKRTKKSEAAKEEDFVPLKDVRESGEYFEDRSPMIIIHARPKVKVAGGSVLLHAYAGRHIKAHFKSDFSRMKLMCGNAEIEPLLPGRVRRQFQLQNQVFDVNDATFDGLYFYPFDAIRPDCGKVKLELFSEKNPDKSETKELSMKSIEAIYNDFASYREERAKGSESTTAAPN
jgi:hypothetical protein